MVEDQEFIAYIGAVEPGFSGFDDPGQNLTDRPPGGWDPQSVFSWSDNGFGMLMGTFDYEADLHGNYTIKVSTDDMKQLDIIFRDEDGNTATATYTPSNGSYTGSYSHMFDNGMEFGVQYEHVPSEVAPGNHDRIELTMTLIF